MQIACDVLDIDPKSLKTRRLAASDAKSIAIALLLRRELAHDEIQRRLRLHSHRAMVAYHKQRHQDRLDTSTPYVRAWREAVERFERR